MQLIFLTHILLQSKLKCILVLIRQNNKIGLTIVEFYNEWMLHIHQYVSFFFSSQAIANCKWQNKQQTLAFKTLHKVNKLKLPILYRIANQIAIKSIFKKHYLLAVNKLNNSIFSNSDSVRRWICKRWYKFESDNSNIKDVHFRSFSRKLVTWKRTALRRRTNLFLFLKKHTLYRKWEDLTRDTYG